MMTANEIQKELITRLKAALPGAEIRETFTGRARRKAEKPVICIGVLKEERGASVCRAKLGLWLYVRREEETAALFEAVCAAIGEMPCALLSVSREEMRYDEALGCMVTACRAEVEAASSARSIEKMRFGNFVFDGLPETLEVKRQGNVREIAEISGRTRAEYTGCGLRKVTGQGVFFGTEAVKRYAELEKRFGREDTLFLPGMAPFTVILSAVTVTEPVLSGAVRFAFRFEETEEKDKSLSGQTYLAAAGESLWDYADRAGVSIEEIVRVNPQIVCINALKEGEEVHIP